MSKIQLVMLALGAALFGGAASISPAAAQDFPWCAQGGELDYPGECAYQTYEQCQASVSGRFLYCGQNPRFLFGQAPQPVPQEPPRRHHRRHAHPAHPG